MEKFSQIKTLPFSIPLSNPKLEESQCRICFESQDKDFLISPCKCSGSMKYVHEECLKLWILSSNPELKSSMCELCKEAFIMEFELYRKCSLENFNDECFNIFIFPFVIIIISTIFAIVLVYLVRGINEGNLGDEEKVYFSLVVFACTTIIVTLMFILVKTVNKACCVMKMKKWNIKSVNVKALDETFEVNQTEVNNHVDCSVQAQPELQEDVRSEPQVIVPREVTKLNGRHVVVPSISQATINRVNREAAAFSRQQSFRSGNNTARRNEGNLDCAVRPFSVERSARE